MSTQAAPPQTYQPIPSTFRRDIYTHWLIARQGDVAMYACTQTHGRGQWLYEVVIVRRRKPETVFGRQQPAREILPSACDFGQYGWQTPSLSRAWQLFDEQVKSRSAGEPRLVHPRMQDFQLHEKQPKPADLTASVGGGVSTLIPA